MLSRWGLSTQISVEKHASAIVIVLHSITVVCPRLLTVGDSVVLFFFSFLSFFLILYGAPAMSLT